MTTCARFCFFQPIGPRLFAWVLAATMPATVHAGTLFGHIDALDSSGYIVTAEMSIYDASHVLVDRQFARAEGLFGSPINTGTSILYTGSLTFAEPFPLAPGGPGIAPLTLSNFQVSLATQYDYFDRIQVQVDWLSETHSLTHDWQMIHGDDFVHGIAYYDYEEWYYPAPYGEPLGNYYANLRMSFASGVPPVPVPAAFWLLGSGLAGIAAVARRRRSR